MKSSHQRYLGVGANVRRLEHINLMARDVRACREFWSGGFGLRTFEIIRRDDGSEDGAWLSSAVQGHVPPPSAGFIRIKTPRSS